ncbi:DedA family protein [Gulosibacter bifidus]|uniref:DedA family protein n=1 Tax=Gulosibacter bifidus TaxID=272239 RepID=A0ABW5RM40_9MICO|nr:DedA family protein [Gulosibacter bifidus]
MLADTLAWLIETVRQLDPAIIIAIAFGGVFLETSLLVGFIVPGDAILLAASAGVDSWSMWAAVVAAAILGAIGGESLGFALGKYFGPHLRHSWLGRRLGERNWQRAESFVQQRGGLAVFISRYLPVLHSLVPVTAGMTGMRYRTFIAWTVPACTLWSLAYVSVGAIATAGFDRAKSNLHLASFIFAGVLIAFAFGTWALKRWLSRRVDRTPDAAADAGADASA